MQEYSQTGAIAHFQAVWLDEEDGKVSATAGLILIHSGHPAPLQLTSAACLSIQNAVWMHHKQTEHQSALLLYVY